MSTEELIAKLRATPEGQHFVALSRDLHARRYDLVEHVVGRSAEAESRIAITSRPDLVEARHAARRAVEATLRREGMTSGQWPSVLIGVAP